MKIKTIKDFRVPWPEIRLQSSGMKTPQQRGFSLIELLAVLGIISLVAAVSLPNIMGYIRSARIRQAQRDVVDAIQKARLKAIAMNAKRGVVFLTQNNKRYWLHIEDDLTTTFSATSMTLNLTTPNVDYSTSFTLPNRVEFGLTAADCPAIASFAPNKSAVRFDRLGIRRIPTLSPAATEPAPIVAGGTPTNLMYAPTAGGEMSLCLVDRDTGFRRTIQVGNGGRVVAQQ